jgi:hypothetical protein
LLSHRATFGSPGQMSELAVKVCRKLNWSARVGADEIEFKVGGADMSFEGGPVRGARCWCLRPARCICIGDAAAQTFAAEAAIGGDHQTLGRDLFERPVDQPGDVLGRLDDGVAVIDDADADLLIGPVLGEERQIAVVAAGAFESDHVSVELQQMRQSALVACDLPINPLLMGGAPAVVHPDLGVETGKLAVDGFELEFEIGIGAVGPGGPAMLPRLLARD